MPENAGTDADIPDAHHYGRKQKIAVQECPLPAERNSVVVQIFLSLVAQVIDPFVNGRLQFVLEKGDLIEQIVGKRASKTEY
jgi:hypothetical protein